MRRSRYAWSIGVFALALAVIAGVGVAITRGVGPLPGQQKCSATVGGHQVDLSPDQARNATLISAIGVRRGLPARAVSIALATAYQESKLVNLDRGDRDSLGLFQQRPSQGWGTAAQVQDPYYASNKFYDALVKIDGFETMRITEAAQKVQRSGFPEAYQPHAEDARALASALTGFSAGGRFSCFVRTVATDGTRRTSTADLTRAFGPLAVGAGGRQDFSVTVTADTAGRRRGWAVAQYLTAHAERLGITAVTFDGRRWRSGDPSKAGWTAYAAAKRTSIAVSLG